MVFKSYVARDRKVGEERFDFIVANEVGQEWYDNSSDQNMPERDWCRQHVRAGFTVVDCGAHHGMMSVLFGKWVGATGKVIAYEILPDNAAVAKQNAVLNKLDWVVVRPFGVGDRNGPAPIRLNRGNVMVVDHELDGRVELVRLDDDLPRTTLVDFLKVDVEGSDLPALRGARRILRQRPIVDLEIHNTAFPDRRAVLMEIFDILSPAIWSYQVLPEGQSEISPVQERVDIDYLARFDNPHVFCLPRRSGLASWRPIRHLRALLVG